MAMKISHGVQRLTLEINKEFETELTRSTLRENGNQELLWLDPGILLVISSVPGIDGEISIGWVRPNNPSKYYLEIQKRTQTVLEKLGVFEGVVSE